MLKVFFLAFLTLLLAGCQELKAPGSTPLPIASLSPTSAATFTTIPKLPSTAPPTSTATLTATPPSTPTARATTTSVPSETITPTSTPEAPEATVLEQAFCRYGPGKAYLYSHGLYTGDHLLVHGKSTSGTWLWVKPDNLNRECWAAASVMEVRGDLKKVHVVHTRLPHTTLYGPPDDVAAVRDGDQVTVSWNRVWMTEDDRRGYLIEATVCEGGRSVWMAVQTEDTSYTFTDGKGCAGASGGQLYAVDKHGYTDPVDIPWP